MEPFFKVPIQVEVPIVMEGTPEVLRVRAAVEEVAVPSTVVVPIARSPPLLRKNHWARPAPADKESCEPVEEALV